MPEVYDPIQKAQQSRYILSCKVLVKECSYEDEQSKGIATVSEKLVFLLPQDSDQRTRFYNTWLPDYETYQEIGIEMGHPLFSSFRAALYRQGKFMDGIHIFVMSKGAEETLKTLDGKIVNVEILGEQEEVLLDGMLDHDLVLNKNAGKYVPKSINLSGED